MSCILHIETSTDVCSVSLSQDGASIFNEEDFKGPSHATQLGVFVDEALSFADSHAIPLDAVAVSCGPGSYTGLRIGVSMAKGICYGKNIPLIGLPTLEVLSVPVLLTHDLPDEIRVRVEDRGTVLLNYMLGRTFSLFPSILKNIGIVEIMYIFLLLRSLRKLLLS